MIGLYAIVHAPTNRAYIGSSKDVQKRFYCHKSFLLKSKHPCTHLQNAFNLYGSSTFKYKLLVECGSREQAQELEQAVLDIWYSDLYNVSKRADHLHRLGRPLSDSAKLKISKANSGAFRSDAQRQQISESLKARYKNGMQSPQLGQKHTEAAREKIKAKRAAQKPPKLGFKASAQTRIKLSSAKIGNRNRAKILCTDDACFFGVDSAAKYYAVSEPTLHKMMRLNDWSFYENVRKRNPVNAQV